jgi:biotin-[acetyl-CoA-carboxylase] ligase BirA-like protein
MKVFTDSVLFAERLIAPTQEWTPVDFSDQDARLSSLMGRLFSEQSVYQNVTPADDDWTHAFFICEAPSSQYDALIECTQAHPEIPGGIVCLAGSGHGFHGQRKRPWVAMEGNIHLSILLTPRRKVERFGVGFPILAAVSVVESIDSIEGLEGKARIKWVNDILCDGAKVAGFLVHTTSMEEIVSTTVLGLSINVEKAPELPPDVHVPKVASIRDFAEERASLNQKEILSILLHRLSENYQLLLDGQWAKLLSIYKKRSLVVGRRVRILTDQEDGRQEELGLGRVFEIGENLELWLDGVEKPIKKGRLILVD